MAYVDQFVYDSSGHTGNTYYARFCLNGSDAGRKAVWDNTNKELSQNPNWVDTAIVLSEVGSTGQFPVAVPDDLPAGRYDVIIHKQAGSVPQNTDDVEKQYTFTKGDIFGF